MYPVAVTKTSNFPRLPRSSSTLANSETLKASNQFYENLYENHPRDRCIDVQNRCLLLEEYGFTPVTFYSKGTMGQPTIVALYRQNQFELELDTITRHTLRVLSRDSNLNRLPNKLAFHN